MVQLVDQHLGLSLLVLMFREIDERGKILNNIATLIPNRAYEEACPELTAILSTVANFHSTVRLALKLGFNSRQRLGIRGVRHQEIEALAENLLPLVSGKREKGIIGKYYGIVGLPGVCKDHRHSRRLTGNDERAEVFPKALDLGFGDFLLFGFFDDVRQTAGQSSRLAAKAASLTS